MPTPLETQPVLWSRQRPVLEKLLVLAVALSVCWFYIWTAKSDVGEFRLKGNGNGYYNQLSHTFLHGHVSLEVEPLAVKPPGHDEYGLGNLPYLMDASFYRGKYYLYFGPTPVLTAFLPYRVLTGNDVDENVVAALFAGAGYLVVLGLLWRVRRRFFPRATWRLMPLLAAMLGLGNVCAVMLRHPLFYEAAIACAFFFQSLHLFALFLSLTAVRPGARVGWLGLASLACGLSVGARATGVFSAFALLLALGWLWSQREDRRGWFPRSFRPIAAAALGPISLCAAALMAYNYVRFGSVLESGIKYQVSFPTVFSPRFIAHNLALYYFSLPSWSWYFPFILPVQEGARPPGYGGVEYLHGQVWSTVWLLPVFGAVLLLWSRRFVAERALGVLFVCTLFSYGTTLLVLLCLGGRSTRYMVDFQPELMLLAALSCFVWEREIPWTAWRRRVAGAGLLLSVGVICLHNIFASLQLYELLKEDNPQLYTAIATKLNAPTDWAGRWLYPRQGPIRLQVQFPTGHKGELEPLLVTGSAEYCDFLAVHYVDEGFVRFVLMHYGRSGMTSETVPLDPTRPHELVIDLGSLYPPLAHPFFASLGRGESVLIKRKVRVSLDGSAVLNGQMDLYDASPNRVFVGENPLAPIYTKERFSGRITQISRDGLAPLLDRPRQSGYGAMVMELTFPVTMAGRNPEPLLTTGEAGLGDALFVKYVDARHVRFGLDHWGVGGMLSEAVEVDPAVAHRLEIWMGSLFPPVGSAEFAGMSIYQVNQLKLRGRVRLDGREVFRASGEFHDAAPGTVAVGSNPIGMSSCGQFFGGNITDYHRMSASAAPPAVPLGPVRLRLKFPEDRLGQSEPLVTTGKFGHGDVVFVTYLSHDKLRFSFDHWGTPPVASEPVDVDFGRSHVVEIDMRSLYPPEGMAQLSAFYVNEIEHLRRVQIRLDDHEVMKINADAYPAPAATVAVGANPIGATTCAAAFGGSIAAVERLGFGREHVGTRNQDYGPMRFEIVFPRDRPGAAEPLMVTGRKGAGDVLLVTYVDQQHVKFSWDHWGKGGPGSALVPVDYNEPHLIEVEMGSFYPEDSIAMKQALSAEEISRRRGRLEVRLDAAPVFSAQGVFFPSRATDVQVGSNLIGASSAGSLFNGWIEDFERPGIAPLK